MTPLHSAAREGHTAVVESLLGAGALVDARNRKRMTPLHYAVLGGHTAVVESILGAGA